MNFPIARDIAFVFSSFFVSIFNVPAECMVRAHSPVTERVKCLVLWGVIRKSAYSEEIEKSC